MELQRIIGIGWDVGGWAGEKQGIAVAQWSKDANSVDWIGLPTQMAIPVGSCLTPLTIISKVADYSLPECEDCMIIIGIDAPLGFPSEFTKLLKGEAGECSRPSSEIENKLAYRDTDRYIHKVFQKKPLSASFDKLGNNSTVALIHIQRWQKDFGYSPHPMNESPNDRKIIIEVYPALVKASQNSEAKSPIKELLPKAIDIGTDAYDAAICAVMAIAYGMNGRFMDLPPLVKPPEGLATVANEGWIYHFPQGTCK